METGNHSSHRPIAAEGLKVVTSNLRSIRNKFDEVLAVVENKHPDIVAFTETWLTKDIKNAEFQIEGYEILRVDRSKKAGGGVILYCSSHLKPVSINLVANEDGNEEFLSCRIRLKTEFCYIGLAYRSPHSKGDLIIDQMRSLAQHQNCLILGDFNVGTINWNDPTPRNQVHSFEYQVLLTTSDNCLHQHIRHPTRIQAGQQPSILDLVFTHDNTAIRNVEYMDPIGHSDHSVISFHWSQQQQAVHVYKPRRNVWKADFAAMRSAAMMTDWNFPPSMGLEEMWNKFYVTIWGLYEKHAPLCRRRRVQQCPPWFDKELKTLLRTRRRLWDACRFHRNESDWEKYKLCRNQCTELKRKKRRSYEDNLAQQSVTAPKRLFAYLRRRTKEGNSIPPLLDPSTGIVIDSDDEKAKIFHNQYASVFSMERLPTEELPLLTNGRLEDCVFTICDVKRLLLKLNTQSAPGPDELHPLILKQLADIIAEPLSLIYRKSLEEARLPTQWKIGVVKPMFKGGDKKVPSNYRPVTLTSVACKVMERIIRETIDRYFETFSLWSSQQHGFCKGRSCTTNLLLAKELWVQAIDQRDNIDAVYVDFSKAFDRVPHGRLVNKLSAYGIAGNLLAWIRDFLIERTMTVRVNESESDPLMCSSGVPQGSVLGPVLFKLFVNDLPEAVKVSCLMYADDLKLWVRIQNDESVDELQTALDALADWSARWLLPVNKEKCHVLPIGSSQSSGTYHLGGYLLDESTSERDLGVIITPDLKPTEDIRKRSAAASRLVWAIRRSFDRLTPTTFRLLFSAHVRPILEFGQPAVYPITKQENNWLERVQRRASKLIEGFKELKYQERLQKLNMFSLDYRRMRADLLYTWRILRGELGEDIKEFFDVSDVNTRGHAKKLVKRRRLRINHSVTLSTRVVNVWNSLPAGVVDADSEVQFKKRIDKYFMDQLGACCHLCKELEPPLVFRHAD